MEHTAVSATSPCNTNGNDCPSFRPFAPNTQRIIKLKKAKYSTSLDPRGYIPVYEYLVNGQPIMWDRESGYVHFTGIWKSLGNSKADIVKMVDSNPELKVKKIRGGFLKIQGTWIPYEYAYILCKRTAWIIRKELVAIFGPRFMSDVIDPSHPEYGCLLLDPSQQRASSARRNSFTTMRQSNTSHPYKRDFMRNSTRVRDTNHHKTTSLLPRQQKDHKTVSSMSLSRLLNSQTTAAMTTAAETAAARDELKKSFNSCNSPNVTPSPTFRVIPTFDQKWPSEDTASCRLLPPIYTNPNDPTFPLKRSDSEPRITPVYSNGHSPSWSPISPVSSETSSTTSTADNYHTDRDIIDTINATILLQRLSQDDGARPFKPMHPDYIPSKVLVGNQEFKICWDNE